MAETPVKPLPPDDRQLDPHRVVEAETEVGTLWLERDAELMTPWVLEHGDWAGELTMLMRSLLRPGMTFVDAGANIGYLSVLGSKLVGAQGRVFCVEADANNVEILRANLWRNECSNARVLSVAAWDQEEELLLVPNPAGGAGSAVFPKHHSEEATSVPAFRLDQLIDGRIDYLKVDCEGVDHRVVDGASGLISANPSMVATVEHMPVHASESISTYRRLGLLPYVFRAFGRIEPTTFERIRELGDRDETRVFDYAVSAAIPRRVTRRIPAVRRALSLTFNHPSAMRRRVRYGIDARRGAQH